MCTGGKVGAQEAIRSDEQLYKRISEACRAKSTIQGGSPDADEPEEQNTADE